MLKIKIPMDNIHIIAASTQYFQVQDNGVNLPLNLVAVGSISESSSDSLSFWGLSASSNASKRGIPCLKDIVRL